jgi:hypothetical protein
MMHKHFSHRRRLKISSLLLALLLFRAYIPVGFMPASGTPFLLELCPAAAPMPVGAAMSMPGDMAPAHDMSSMPDMASMAGDMASMPMSGAASMAGQHQHSGIHAHFDNCPFGSAPATGPVSSLVVFEAPGRLVCRYRPHGETLLFAVRQSRAHPARGPPSLV